MRVSTQDSNAPGSSWRRQIAIRAAHVEPGRWAITILPVRGTEECEVRGEGGHICGTDHIRSRWIGRAPGCIR